MVKQTKTKKETPQENWQQQVFYFSHPDITQPIEGFPIVQKSRSERLKLAIDELQIGRRVREELRNQGRTVGWLAKLLDMERTSLYYTFRQNSIDLGMLVRISFYLDHNFIQDLDNVYKSYGL